MFLFLWVTRFVIFLDNFDKQTSVIRCHGSRLYNLLWPNSPHKDAFAFNNMTNMHPVYDVPAIRLNTSKSTYRYSPGKKRILQGITVCLVCTILGAVWWPGRFQTVSWGQVLVFFYRHSTRMYLMKEKQGGPIPTGLKRWPLKLIKHLADTTCVSPSPAGQTGGCPLNFLYLINLKFWVRAPNGCCIL